MVRWLTELLFLFESDRIIFSRFKVRTLTKDLIEALGVVEEQTLTEEYYEDELAAEEKVERKDQ